MNKLIATIALAALAFTSCIKENDTWKEMLPVQPGMYIYQLATDQDKLAMRPANAALRLAMLLAEADKQGEDVLSADLKEIVVKKGDASIKVWETLFGAHTKLERQGEDYLITYSDEAQLPDGFFMAGSVLVKTNGAKVLNQSSYSAPWTVEMQDLKVFAYTNTGLRQAFNFDEGETTLYFDGADSYIIGASSFVSISIMWMRPPTGPAAIRCVPRIRAWPIRSARARISRSKAALRVRPSIRPT